jgi:ribosomal protein S12 methylthiotransferase
MIGRIRSLDPLAGIRATFILGFPGETDDDAAEVEHFVDGSDLDWIGTFTYSREEGTRSHAMTEQVPAAVARERAERVSAAADEAMSRRASALVGSRLEVLVERLELNTRMWIGRSRREAPEVDGEIRFEGSELRVGDYVDVLITDNEGADLLGSCV